MPANVCPICATPWPHNEVYKTSFGTRAVRSVNDECPHCGVPTFFSRPAVPLTDAELAERHADHETQQRLDNFETWYADHAAHQLMNDLDAWLALDTA